MRRLAFLLALALAVTAPEAAVAKGPAHPGKHYCKKHAKHLTKQQRRWCKRKRRHHSPPSQPAPTTPAPAPLTQPPAVDPTLGTAPTPTAPASTPTITAARLAVSAKEYSITLSRTQIAAGPAIVELQNNGEDPHDLRIEPLDGTSAATDFDLTGPGELDSRRLTLAAGSYKLYCTLGSHDALGMHATLTVAP